MSRKNGQKHCEFAVSVDARNLDGVVELRPTGLRFDDNTLVPPIIHPDQVTIAEVDIYISYNTEEELQEKLTTDHWWEQCTGIFESRNISLENISLEPEG